jgi:hypothetical protein
MIVTIVLVAVSVIIGVVGGGLTLIAILKDIG